MIGLYLIVVAAAGLQGYLLTHLALRAARRLRLLDWPDRSRKLHRRPTPLMGGVAVILTLVLGVLECRLLGWGGFSETTHAAQFTWGLLGSAAVLCGIGLWDDKFGMPASRKFLLQVAAILPFVLIGRPSATLTLFGWELQPAWLQFPVILLWLVSCTNFVNLVDGLDGLAGTVSLIVCVTVATLSWMNHLETPLFASLVLCGSLAGFLVLNWPPARIFLGDSGSLPLGFLVGALSLEASLKTAAGLTLAVPILLLSVPIFDTSMAILRRKLNGRRIDQGDREHIHHCLRDRGLTPAQTLCAISGMCAGTAASAVLSALLDSELFGVLMCLGMLTVLVWARVFGFKEFVLLSRTALISLEYLRDAPRGLRNRLLVARLSTASPSASESCGLWAQLVQSTAECDGTSLRFACIHPRKGEEVFNLDWCRDQTPSDQLADEGKDLRMSSLAMNASAGWELHYTVTRADGLVVTLAARGDRQNRNSSQGLLELMEMFAAFGPRIPLPATVDHADSGSETPAPEFVHSRHGEIPEPHILALPMGQSLGKGGTGRRESRVTPDAA